MDKYMTIRETAEKWNVSILRVNTLCQEGRIPGAIKFGYSWAIPRDIEKPKDLRIRSGKYMQTRDEER